jgi:predicted acetyltransferase
MDSTKSLRLRPLQYSDEAAFRRAHTIMSQDNFDFALGLEAHPTFQEFVDRHAAAHKGEQLQPGRVPSTFLVAVVGEVIVGRTSIRHELTEWLFAHGGHIGYGVLPEHRRNGHAGEILRQSLIIARSIGIDRVLVTCDDDSVASARTIENCGGVFESFTVHNDGSVPTRRYWID